MDWYQSLIEWIRGFNKKADQATQKGEQIIKDGFRTVDEAAHKAGDKIKDIMKPIDELGAKIGGEGNKKGMGKDLK